MSLFIKIQGRWTKCNAYVKTNVGWREIKNIYTKLETGWKLSGSIYGTSERGLHVPPVVAEVHRPEA
jgi:hypothetical protein